MTWWPARAGLAPARGCRGRRRRRRCSQVPAWRLGVPRNSAWGGMIPDAITGAVPRFAVTCADAQAARPTSTTATTPRCSATRSAQCGKAPPAARRPDRPRHRRRSRAMQARDEAPRATQSRTRLLAALERRTLSPPPRRDAPRRCSRRWRAASTPRGELDLHRLRRGRRRNLAARIPGAVARRRPSPACGSSMARAALGERRPVLKNLVDRVLRQRADVLAFPSPPVAQGGSGAVLVLLEKRGRRTRTGLSGLRGVIVRLGRMDPDGPDASRFRIVVDGVLRSTVLVEPRRPKGRLAGGRRYQECWRRRPSEGWRGQRKRQCGW